MSADQPALYRIRIEGHLDPSWSDRMGGLAIEAERAESVAPTYFVGVGSYEQGDLEAAEAADHRGDEPGALEALRRFASPTITPHDQPANDYRSR